VWSDAVVGLRRESAEKDRQTGDRKSFRYDGADGSKTTKPRRSSPIGLLAMLTMAFLTAALDSQHPALASEDDTQQWTTVKAQHKLDDRFTLSLASRLRFDEDVSRAKDLFLRPAVEVKVLPPFSLGLGYDYIYSYASNSSTEHRIWEQASVKLDLGDLSIGNRLRIEQRFIDDADGVVVRARYRLRLEHPLGASVWKVIGSDEVFANLNSQGAGPVSGFEQNRLFGGVGRNLWDRLWIEAGYQWGCQEERDKQDQVTHSLLVNVTYDF
jgi:hypothetical protein